MSVKVYVGNLSVSVVHSHLEELSAQAGTVESVEIVDEAKTILPSVRLKELGIEPGEKLGVIQVASEDEARAVAEFLDGQELFDRILVAMAGPHGGSGPRPPKFKTSL